MNQNQSELGGCKNDLKGCEGTLGRISTEIYLCQKAYEEKCLVNMELKEAMLEEYTKTIERIRDRVFVETGCRIVTDWYRERLDEGKLLIVQCLVPGDADGMHDENLHWIFLYGYEEDEFLACDPLSHKIRLTGSEAERYTHTPAGSICVAVGESSGNKEGADERNMRAYPAGCLRK